MLKNYNYEKSKTPVDFKVPFKGYGNNPEPVKSEGHCCDECYETVVFKAWMEKIIDSWIEEDE